MNLGHKIKQLRAEKSLTQKELANQLFVSRQTISNWETNKSFPSIDYIESISKNFNISIDELLAYKEDKSVPSESDSITKQNRIRKNKERVVLNRLLYYRVTSVYSGTLIASYFFFSKRHLNYIWAPLLIILFGLLLTVPIEYIKNKHQLDNKKDIIRFLDELYD